jgi:glycosyltransferase involved in cell wall biosynthesis
MQVGGKSEVSRPEWHIVTGEYPPQMGGVSDYTYAVAGRLAAEGEKVHVWCPGENGGGGVAVEDGVIVHRELGHLARANLRRAGRIIDELPKPRRLLVQWVPHSYGYRSMNLFFCWWILRRATFQRDTVEIMVHEPFLPFDGRSLRRNVAATIHRVMAAVILKASSRVWVSIPRWEKLMRPYALGKRLTFQWLPVPSGIPVVSDPEGVTKLRSRYAPAGEFIIGHFSTYDSYTKELLAEVVPALLNSSSRQRVLLLGKGSAEVRKTITTQHPEHAGRVHATGAITAVELSKHISACEVMLQPYQDGVSTRRTSVMAALAHGTPVITTKGPATETVWLEAEAVKLACPGDVKGLVAMTESLLADVGERERMSVAAKSLYLTSFDLKYTINALQSAA